VADEKLRNLWDMEHLGRNLCEPRPVQDSNCNSRDESGLQRKTRRIRWKWRL
jgi:hypothetical protein